MMIKTRRGELEDDYYRTRCHEKSTLLKFDKICNDNKVDNSYKTFLKFYFFIDESNHKNVMYPDVWEKIEELSEKDIRSFFILQQIGK
jgi:hypothetical protein